MAEERSDLNVVDRVDPSDELISREDDKALRMNPETGSDDEDTPAEAEHIMGQIEETRSQMGETIDAIQDRLSFSNLSEQVSDHVSNAVETAKEAVYDATIGKAANMMKNVSNTTIVRTVKENPLPFILIGAGAGLLAYQSYAGKGGNGRYRRNDLAGAASGVDRHQYSDPGQHSLTDTARETLSGVKGRVTDAAGNALNKVSGAVDTAYTGAGEMVSKARVRAGELGTQAYDVYDHYLEENPLAVGAVALAVGAAVGFAIPSTRYEGELLGDAREQLMSKAQDTASHLLDQAKQVVSEAGQNLTQQTGHTTTH
jgi:ElaB/YqjD/DUF883 family membrane-anchored ribosome-binding protein